MACFSFAGDGFSDRRELRWLSKGDTGAARSLLDFANGEGLEPDALALFGVVLATGVLGSEPTSTCRLRLLGAILRELLLRVLFADLSLGFGGAFSGHGDSARTSAEGGRLNFCVVADKKKTLESHYQRAAFTLQTTKPARRCHNTKTSPTRGPLATTVSGKIGNAKYRI